MPKCVGGPADGKDYAIPKGSRYIEIYESRIPKDFSWKLYMAPEKLEDLVAIESTVTPYTLRYLRGSKDLVIEYLTPADWTDEQAIRHQFSK